MAHRETDDFKALFKTISDEELLDGAPKIVVMHALAGFEAR